MTALATVRLIALRELRARRRAFLISTGLLLLVVIAGISALAIADIDVASDPEWDENADAVVAMIGTVMLFGAIIGYGQVVLMGVAEEKSSRVVEVVLGCVPPSRLLAGKVIGIGLFGLTQFILVVGTAGVMLATLDTVPVPPATGKTMLVVGIFFLLGYTLYAAIYAAVGTLMSRTENASNAAGPLNLLVGVGYMTTLLSLSNVENPVMRVVSLLPPFAPIALPIRIAGGEIAVWEVVLGVALLLAAIYGINRLAARLYLGGVMRGGAKSRLRQAWRAAEL